MGSGPRYMIYVTHFALKKTHGHARKARDFRAILACS